MFNTNEYFDGQVKSIGFNTDEGPATVGVMAKGEYEFGTTTVEYITVTSGLIQVLLPGDKEWNHYREFETFKVEKDIKFRVKVLEDSSYRCLYK